jgi:rhamnosyltransferase
MKIALTVILYNPSEQAFNNIVVLGKYFSAVFVFDNSTIQTELQKKIKLLPNIVFISNAENNGIAAPLNQASNLAIEQGFDWLLTMDQDSCFTEKELPQYLSLIEAYPSKNMVAQFGCSYGQINPKGIIAAQESKEVDILITSGSVMNLKLFAEIGPFDENYFIDHVDNDYCIQSVIKGYKLVQFLNITLTHTLGDTKKRRSFKTLYLIPKRRTVHNAIRCYYMERNMLYLENKFKQYHLPQVVQLRKNLNKYLKQCLYYNGDFWNTRAKLKKAKQDFENGKMGRLEHL